ncbi:uncharacterized protein LOC105385434 [Plutella xylostella]|uniref:uncharacterized protein LOC105385434 n=1 Tax=Plutella xylostella TaxID=51655 RepID=UPI0020321E69|nr:uncharacterized protein LOC105385434 [Plutella xylostella]
MEIFGKCCILLVLVLCQVASEAVGSCFNESSCAKSDKFNHSRVLSRRKRFLVFPEGSSLQLVFCVQTAALIPIGYVGQLFLYGNTIALAWVLPKDPSFLTMFKDKDVFSAQRRTDDVRHIYYVGENGEFLKKVPYKRLGGDGRGCLLRQLCEAAQPSTQRTFLTEVFRVLFT